MKKFFKVCLSFVACFAVLSCGLFVGCKQKTNVDNNNNNNNNDASTVYYTVGQIITILESASEKLGLSTNASTVANIASTYSSSTIDENKNSVIISDEKNELLLDRVQADKDVFTEVEGSTVQCGEGIELDFAALTQRPLTMVLNLYRNYSDTDFINNTALTFQLRDLNMQPDSFDIKISVSADYNSLTIKMAYYYIDSQTPFNTEVLVFLFDTDLSVTDIIFSTNMFETLVYAWYNIELDHHFYLDSSKDGYENYAEEITEVISEFESCNSYLVENVDANEIFNL